MRPDVGPNDQIRLCQVVRVEELIKINLVGLLAVRTRLTEATLDELHLNGLLTNGSRPRF